MSIIKARSPFTIKNTEPSPPAELPAFTCADTVISGLAIAADGTVTNPTVTVGTFHSIEPSTFDEVEEDTVHNVVVYVTYDSNDFNPPSQTSTEIGCVVQVTQDGTPPTSTCQTWRVYNNHTSAQAFVNWNDCSGTSQVYYVGDGSYYDICVKEGEAPTVMVDGNLAYAINLQTTCT